jgi:hypothetical protein
MPSLTEKEKAFREQNQEAIAIATFELQKEALQQNLIIMHRTMLIAFFAVLIALTIGIVTVVVTVMHRPDITVKVYSQKTIQTTP